MKNTVLVIEDDADIASLLRMHLEDADFAVQHANDGDKGVELFHRWKPQLVILDVMLPGMDGLSVCREIRKINETVSILMLTAKSTELDRVLGLEMGADDYLTKPFSLAELMARVKALFRRSKALSAVSEPAEPDNTLDRGRLQIDANKHSASVDGQALDLTAREFDLLWFLAKHPGRVYTRAQLLDSVWGYDHDGYEHTVNTHINRLRIKVEKDAAKPEFVQTVWGVGYKFTE
ncbi:MAG: two-component system OmpR family response regulator [Saprospiraceae bacterium]|jgi:two-component system OmpR family response regulator